MHTNIQRSPWKGQDLEWESNVWCGGISYPLTGSQDMKDKPSVLWKLPSKTGSISRLPFLFWRSHWKTVCILINLKWEQSCTSPSLNPASRKAGAEPHLHIVTITDPHTSHNSSQEKYPLRFCSLRLKRSQTCYQFNGYHFCNCPSAASPEMCLSSDSFF